MFVVYLHVSKQVFKQNGKAAEYTSFDGVRVPSCGHVLLLFYPFGNATQSARYDPVTWYVFYIKIPVMGLQVNLVAVLVSLLSEQYG